MATMDHPKVFRRLFFENRARNDGDQNIWCRQEGRQTRTGEQDSPVKHRKVKAKRIPESAAQ